MLAMFIFCNGQITIAQVGKTPTLNPQIYNLNEKNIQLASKFMLYEQWTIANIYHIDGFQHVGIPIKYDILENYFKIKTSKGLRYLPGDEVKKFECVNPESGMMETFINSSYFKNNTINTGFLQVLENGYFNLYKSTFIELTKGQRYIKIIDASIYFDDVERKNCYFIATEENLKDLIPSKKGLAKNFEQFNISVTGYIRQEKLKTRNEEDLKKIIRYCNSQAVMAENPN